MASLDRYDAFHEYRLSDIDDLKQENSNKDKSKIQFKNKYFTLPRMYIIL